MSIARLMQMARAGIPAGGGDVWTDPDLANASYDSVSFSVAGQDVTPRGIFFSASGSHLYVLGGNGDDINQYSLSTPWDISSASYVQNFSVSAQDLNPWGISFKVDGTKMYVVGDTNDSIFEYDLSTAWNISTASYVQSFSVSAQTSLPIGLCFKEDGSKLFFVDFTNDQVEEYSLSTPWDISTATHTQALIVSPQVTQPIDGRQRIPWHRHRSDAVCNAHIADCAISDAIPPLFPPDRPIIQRHAVRLIDHRQASRFFNHLAGFCNQCVGLIIWQAVNGFPKMRAQFVCGNWLRSWSRNKRMAAILGKRNARAKAHLRRPLLVSSGGSILTSETGVNPTPSFKAMDATLPSRTSPALKWCVVWPSGAQDQS